MTDIVKLKCKMVENGDECFIKTICELLGVSRPTAVSRLAGKSEFTSKEISKIVEAYDLDSEEMKNIFIS